MTNTTTNLWYDFYTTTFPSAYSRKVNLYQAVWDRYRQVYGAAANNWPREIRAECEQRSHNVSAHCEREMRRMEHDLHVRMGEAGLYLWCRHCDTSRLA